MDGEKEVPERLVSIEHCFYYLFVQNIQSIYIYFLLYAFIFFSI